MDGRFAIPHCAREVVLIGAHPGLASEEERSARRRNDVHWILLLQEQGTDVAVVVTHLWDGPIALGAATELARALPGELLACGLAPDRSQSP